MRKLSGTLLAAVLALLPGWTAAQVQPTTSTRVVLESARVTELTCSSRGARMENTGSVCRRYPYMTGRMFTKDLDPRPMLMGFFAIILLIPITVLAVPTDLLAMPFRRRCDFNVRLSGRLIEWAGREVPDTGIAVEGRNLLKAGLPGQHKAEFFTDKASAVSDDRGRFSISLKGHTGRSREYELHWTIDGRESSVMKLRKRGGKFELSEPEPGFGAGAHEMEPVLITPEEPGAAPPEKT